MRFLADENVDNRLIRGLLRIKPELDIVRAQDVNLMGVDDPSILAWAADEDRIVLTRDVQTMIKYAYDRVEAGQPMPGIFEIPEGLPIADAIQELILIIDASEPEEWSDKITFLPLK